ncbi:MAG TPA: hypothetical protein VFJ02_06800, partial [Vicinamibacterales bacterium]|nr:hypothetical protein [Vicinamibacterales bacterium]
MKMLVPSLLASVLLAAGCSRPAEAPAAAAAPAAAKVPLSSLPKTQTAAMLEHIKVLSSDEYEGRAPGTPGEEKTVKYLESEFQKLGLKPGNTDGTYVQKVPLVVSGAGSKATFKWKDDVVAWTKHV